MLKRLSTILALTLVILLGGFFVSNLLIKIAEASHWGIRCATFRGNNYCVTASGNYSGSGPFTGNVTVTQYMPVRTGIDDAFATNLSAEWWSPSTGWVRKSFGAWQYNQITTAASEPFSFSGVSDGWNYYYGLSKVYWYDSAVGDYVFVGNGETLKFSILIPPPLPVPSTPGTPSVSPDPSTTNDQLTFNWGASTNATIYYIDTDSGTCQSDGCTSATNSYSWPASNFGVGNHWVRVKAWNASGVSSYSSQTNFTVNRPLPAPGVPFIGGASCSGPVAAIRHGDTNTACWNAVSGATSYNFYANTNVGPSCAAGCPLTGTQVGPGANNISYTAGDFWAYVTACNSNGCSVPSPTTNFTIQSNNAAFVSQNVPNTVRPGEPFTASVTFRNTGASTWDAPGQYVLRSEVGSFELSLDPAVASPTVVAPNQAVTFSGPFRIDVSGTYPYRWRMYRKENNFGFFGQSGPNSTIRVTGPVSAVPIRVQLQIRAKQHLPLQ